MSNLWQSNPAYREQVAKERADERRKVIEELAREAEAQYKAFWSSGFDVGNYDPLDQFEDDPFAAIPEDKYYSMHLGRSVAAWLRQHAEEEG